MFSPKINLEQIMHFTPCCPPKITDIFYIACQEFQSANLKYVSSLFFRVLIILILTPYNYFKSKVGNWFKTCNLSHAMNEI